MEQKEYVQRYWLVLFEINERKFSFVQWRTLKKILNLTYRRGLPDVYVAKYEILAESIGTDRHNLQKILARLESRQILARRGQHWWINDITLWQALADDVHTDTDALRRAGAADARLLEDNPLQPTGQLGLWPAEITDAEFQAEANQEHAAGRSLLGELPAASPDDLAAGARETGGKNNHGAEGTPTPVVKITTDDEVNTMPVVKITTGASTMSRDPVRVRPGNQEIKPGNQEPGKTGGNYQPLKAESFSLFDEFMGWCEEAGPAATPKQIEQWRWRAKYHPGLMERCLRETQAVVKEGRQPVHNRGGFCKMLWRKWAKEEKAPVAELPQPKLLAAEGMLAASNKPSAPLDPEEERRGRETFERKMAEWKARQRPGKGGNS